MLASISTAVVIFQSITANRLLTPSIMGLDSVYLFIKVLPVFLLGTSQCSDKYLFEFSSNSHSDGSVFLVLFQGMFKLGHFSVYFILLVGVVLGTFFRSITGFIQLIMNPDDFLTVQSAMFASFDASNSKLVLISSILLIILIVIAFILRPYLDVLLLGKISLLT